MLEGAQRGLQTFAFSTHQLSRPKDPFWVFTLGSWKPGWGQKPALSRGRAWAPAKTAAIFACCCFPQPPVSTQPLPRSAGKHEEPPAALAQPKEVPRSAAGALGRPRPSPPPLRPPPGQHCPWLTRGCKCGTASPKSRGPGGRLHRQAAARCPPAALTTARRRSGSQPSAPTGHSSRPPHPHARALPLGWDPSRRLPPATRLSRQVCGEAAFREGTAAGEELIRLASQRVSRQRGEQRRFKLFAEAGFLSEHRMRQFVSNGQEVTATLWSKLALLLVSSLVWMLAGGLLEIKLLMVTVP